MIQLEIFKLCFAFRYNFKFCPYIHIWYEINAVNQNVLKFPFFEGNIVPQLRKYGFPFRGYYGSTKEEI